MSLQITYHSFNPDRADVVWSKIESSNSLKPIQKYSKAIYNMMQEHHMFDSDTLIWLDMFFGCINAELPKPGTEYEAILDIYKLGSFNNGSFDGNVKEWIRAIESVKEKSLLQKKAKLLSKKAYANESKAITALRQFFKAMKPLIEDVQMNTRSQLVQYVVDGDSDSDKEYKLPKTFTSLLRKRAKKNRALCISIIEK